MATYPSRETLKWLQSLNLSLAIRNIRRDFADGVLTAEILQRYFPNEFNLHAFSSASGVDTKKGNWDQIRRFLEKKHIMSLTMETCEDILRSHAKSVCFLLHSLHSRLAHGNVITLGKNEIVELSQATTEKDLKRDTFSSLIKKSAFYKNIDCTTEGVKGNTELLTQHKEEIRKRRNDISFRTIFAEKLVMSRVRTLNETVAKKQGEPDVEPSLTQANTLNAIHRQTRADTNKAPDHSSIDDERLQRLTVHGILNNFIAEANAQQFQVSASWIRNVDSNLTYLFQNNETTFLQDDIAALHEELLHAVAKSFTIVDKTITDVEFNDASTAANHLTEHVISYLRCFFLRYAGKRIPISNQIFYAMKLQCITRIESLGTLLNELREEFEDDKLYLLCLEEYCYKYNSEIPVDIHDILHGLVKSEPLVQYRCLSILCLLTNQLSSEHITDTNNTWPHKSTYVHTAEVLEALEKILLSACDESHHLIIIFVTNLLKQSTLKTAQLDNITNMMLQRQDNSYTSILTLMCIKPLVQSDAALRLTYYQIFGGLPHQIQLAIYESGHNSLKEQHNRLIVQFHDENQLEILEQLLTDVNRKGLEEITKEMLLLLTLFSTNLDWRQSEFSQWLQALTKVKTLLFRAVLDAETHKIASEFMIRILCCPILDMQKQILQDCCSSLLECIRSKASPNQEELCLVFIERLLKQENALVQEWCVSQIMNCNPDESTWEWQNKLKLLELVKGAKN